MDLLINGVKFREAAEDPKSPVQSYNADGGRTSRIFRSPISTEAERYAAAVALLGYPVLVDLEGVSYISRQLPHAYPAIVHDYINPQGYPHMFCTEVAKIEPYGKPLGIDNKDRAIYDWKVIEANYNALPYLVWSDAEVVATGGPLMGYPDEGAALASGWLNSRFITRSREYAPKTITIKQGMPCYVETAPTDRAALPEGLAIVQYRVRVSYTWHQVPLGAIPHQAMAQLANHVNYNTFDYHEPDTLVYTGTKERPTPGPLGNFPRLVDLEHTFLYVPNVDIEHHPTTGVPTLTVRGLNAVPRVKDKKIRYWPISTDGDRNANSPITNPNDWNDYSVFRRGDLTRLFRPDQPPGSDIGPV